MAKFIGIGTKLMKGDTASIGTPVAIAYVKTIGGPQLQTAQVDATDLSSPGGFREFLAGLRSPGSVPFTANFDPNDATQDGDTGILAEFLSGEVKYYRIEYPITGKKYCDFQAFMQEMSFNITPDNPAEFSGSLQISGLPVWGDGTP